MHYDFCTLFDKNYLLRGLALHSSLVEHCVSFHLWILCMDEDSHKILTKLKLKFVSLIKLSEIEDKELLTVKCNRTTGEYCWTLTPSLPKYILNKYSDINLISYLDADLYFYSDPLPIFQEIEKKSIMIIPHRFASLKRFKNQVNGVYNVGMMSFRRDKDGLKCLEWWRQRCLEWCYYRFEEGKIGDQKYLDQFPVLFQNVCSLKHIGAGVGPWNIRKYKITIRDNKIYVGNMPLIFHHFADLKIYPPLRFLPSSPIDNYGEVTPNRSIVYEPYFKCIYDVFGRLHEFFPDFIQGFTPRPRGIAFAKELLLNLIIGFLFRKA